MIKNICIGKYRNFAAIKLIIFIIGVFCINHPKTYAVTQQTVDTLVNDTISVLPQDTLVNTEADSLAVAIADSSQQVAEYVESEALKALRTYAHKFDTRNISKYLLDLFFTEDQILIAKNNLIQTGKSYLPLYLHRFYTSSINIAFQFPIIIFLSIFILFFLFNISIVLTVLNYSIKNKNQREKYVRIYTTMYEGLLLDYMFGEKTWEETAPRLKKIHKTKNRKILVSILFNFHENLRGEVDNYMPDIYMKLDLHQDALKNAGSLLTHRKVQAVRELTYFYPSGVQKLIPQLINDPDDNIRAEAQTAFIRLNQKNPFNFLKLITRSFSRWTQLYAFYLLRLHQLPVPMFADFLHSKHFDVRNFCLRMIIYYQQLESISIIFKMIESSKEETRYLSYKAINDLRIYDGKLIIKRKYRYETERNQLEIIKAFRNIGNEEDLDFLEIIIRTESVSLKTEACRSMYFIGSEGREKLLKLSRESDEGLELYIAHVKDSRN